MMLSQGLIWTGSAAAQADSSSSLHAGTVEIHNAQEAKLFERLLCQCGECQRLPLSTCACSWAENARAKVRAQLADGVTVAEVQELFRQEHGAKAIAIPSDKGLDRALWAVPLLLMLAGLGLLVWLGRRWLRKNQPLPSSAGVLETSANYERVLDEELRRLED
jgi:cytochrome c-type biogenesis protein CcmH/NrfF